MPETAFEEFKFVKNHFHKEDGRQYYHIVQSFNPDDNLSPQTAHEIGLKFAEYFPDFQILVATHIDKDHIHNHLVMNSVSFRDGKKFHQSRDEMLTAKRYSNQICREYGLSTTEVKSSYSENPKWKQLLRNYIAWSLRNSATKEEFIENMGNAWLRCQMERRSQIHNLHRQKWSRLPR